MAKTKAVSKAKSSKNTKAPKGDWLERNRKRVNIALAAVLLVATLGFGAYWYVGDQKVAGYRNAGKGWVAALNDCNYEEYKKYDYVTRLFTEAQNETAQELGSEVEADEASPENFTKKCESAKQSKYSYVKILKDVEKDGKRSVSLLFTPKNVSDSQSQTNPSIQVIVTKMKLNEDGSKEDFVVIGAFPYYEEKKDTAGAQE